MQNFPQYKLNDFYGKRYYEGGVHLYQAYLMYEHVLENKNQEYKFYAALQGFDLDKLSQNNSSDSTSDKLEEQQKQQDLPIFRDPDEYDNCSEEEKERMTKEMMGKHKQWVSEGNIVGN